MPFRTFVIAVITAAWLAPAFATHASAANLDVMSYNINWGAPSGKRLDAIAKVIASSGADVAGLQQVRRFARVAKKGNYGCVDQPRKLVSALQRYTGDRWYWAYAANTSARQSSKHCKSITSTPRQEGVLIVSRYPISHAEAHRLPYSRGLARALVNAPGGPVAVYTVHLDSGSTGKRAVQARRVADIIRRDRTPSIFVTGDMNDKPGKAPLKVLRGVVKDSWAQVGKGSGATRNARIDYVLYRGRAKPQSARVIQTWVSDHRPVVARFSVN
ncbi:MAG TPA: endonuclease/exonuclease/phosphatase family protein [Thermodesulfobacteriota bacterium]